MTVASSALDLEALLRPIPGVDPAGADLRYLPIYDKIKAARRAADDKQYGRSAHSDADDGLKADDRAAAAREYWRTALSLITDTLATKSKDLQLAVWLLEAESYIGGFSGAGNALELIRRLLEDYWDTAHPAIEEDDEPLAVRVGVLSWINDRLPGIFAAMPLSGSSSLSLADYEFAQKATDHAAKEELAKANRPSAEQFLEGMAASSAPHLEAMAGLIDECLARVTQLEAVTDVRFVVHSVTGGVERSSPLLSFGQVRKVLEDCQFEVGRALRTKAPHDARSAHPVGAKPAPAREYGGSTQPEDGIWDRALQLVAGGQLDGLRLAQDHIEAAASGRERFLRQLRLSELCLQAGMHAFAYPILDDLGRIIDERNLETWEDIDVMRRAWSGLADVCRQLARLRPESVAREAVAKQRLSALANDDGNAGGNS